MISVRRPLPLSASFVAAANRLAGRYATYLMLIRKMLIQSAFTICAASAPTGIYSLSVGYDTVAAFMHSSKFSRQWDRQASRRMRRTLRQVFGLLEC